MTDVSLPEGQVMQNVIPWLDLIKNNKDLVNGMCKYMNLKLHMGDIFIAFNDVEWIFVHKIELLFDMSKSRVILFHVNS